MLLPTARLQKLSEKLHPKDPNMLPKNKVFINSCPTGMVSEKIHNPYLPITCEEIIEEGLMLAELGVSILHLHAREDDGLPTWKKDVYRRIIYGIRERNQDIIICVSTSGRLWSDFERRSEVLELEGDYKPDMASLTLGSLNFINTHSTNSPEMIVDLAKKMLDLGIKPELEIFDTGMLNQMHVLIKKELLTPPYYVNIIFGNIYSMQLDLQTACYILDKLPENTIAAFAGLGRFQLPTTHLALALGKGVRIGLEDNLYLDFDKRDYATNSILVNNAVGVIKAMGKAVCTSQELRNILLPLTDYALAKY